MIIHLYHTIWRNSVWVSSFHSWWEKIGEWKKVCTKKLGGEVKGKGWFVCVGRGGWKEGRGFFLCLVLTGSVLVVGGDLVVKSAKPIPFSFSTRNWPISLQGMRCQLWNVPVNRKNQKLFLGGGWGMYGDLFFRSWWWWWVGELLGCERSTWPRCEVALSSQKPHEENTVGRTLELGVSRLTV